MKRDVDTMTQLQADQIEKKLIKQINKISEEACNNANILLKIYGLKAKMQIVLEKEQQ